jgi:hypothetical protein
MIFAETCECKTVFIAVAFVFTALLLNGSTVLGGGFRWARLLAAQ